MSRLVCVLIFVSVSVSVAGEGTGDYLQSLLSALLNNPSEEVKEEEFATTEYEEEDALSTSLPLSAPQDDPPVEIGDDSGSLSLAELLGSLFDLPRRSDEPDESGLLMTTEDEAEGASLYTPFWSADQFGRQPELETLTRQNIFDQPPPFLQLLMKMIEMTEESNQRRRLMQTHARRRQLDGSSALSDLDLSSSGSGAMTGNVGGSSESGAIATDASATAADASSGDSASSSGSSLSSLLNPTDVLTLLDLVNGGVNLGTEVITGQTTTKSPVQRFAQGVQSIVYGAKELNTVFSSVLNLVDVPSTISDAASVASASTDGEAAAAESS